MRGNTGGAKSSFKSLVNDIRSRLLSDLKQSCYQRYSLNAKDRNKVALSCQEHLEYSRLFTWLNDPSRFHQDWETNLKDLIKERAYTLTNRLVILMQLESRDLRKVKLISQGVEKSAFRTEQEFFVALTQGDDRGFHFILQQVWDQLALELPALFEYNEIHECIPIPGPTLLWLIDRLNAGELEDVWKDDTTLGWLYQYWNDPDRKAVDAKLNNTSGKVEAHELSDKTQLFTERYMVEWLVQNSLGAQWLAICAKQGWSPEANKIIENLKLRRTEWNKKIDLEEVPETEAMPIHGDEEFWKFYVPQDLAKETIEAAPLLLEQVKILDPAMGSGHFLVYVFDFLFKLYKDQARLLKTEYKPKHIVDWILNNNLHGIDIDNRAVQIGAAALYIKTQEKVAGYKVEKLNLVASDLGLSHLKKDDPGVLKFTSTLEKELGIHREISYEIINTLKGAEYLGSLLQVDKEIDRIVKSYRAYNQAEDISVVRDKVFGALTNFVHNHDQGEDLGVRSLAEQLGKGLRLIGLLGQKYGVVVANPPYLGIAKARKEIGEEIQLHYQEGKGDLYSIFMIRALQMLKEYGKCAMVTLRGWMFLSQFEEVRLKILRGTNLLTIGDLHLGAFHDMKDVSAMMFVYQNSNIITLKTRIVRPVPKLEIRRDQYQIGRNIRGLLRANEVYTFSQSRFAEISGSPMIYWWPEEFRQAYLETGNISSNGVVKMGVNTGNNDRFTKNWFELLLDKIVLENFNNSSLDANKLMWIPYVKGAKMQRWFEPLRNVLKFHSGGFELKQAQELKFGSWRWKVCNQEFYFKQGLAFSYIGTNGFLCRLRKYKSIFDVGGSSIFCDNPEKMQVILSSNISGYVSQSINPTVNNQVSDIANLPVLDQLRDYTIYLKRAEVLYDQLFSSTESNLEYTYENLSSEEFEVEEARIRDEIDKELFAQFTIETVKAIYKEIGPSPFNFPQWNPTTTIPKDFPEAYQSADSILSLSQKYRLHPDSIHQLKNKLNLIHEGQRKDKAFKDLSWATGVLLGRFDAQTGGLVELAEKRRLEQDLSLFPTAPKAHSQGLLYLSILDNHEGLNRPEFPNVGKGCLQSLKDTLSYKWGEEKSNELWQEIENALVLDCRTDWTVAQQSKKTLNNWIRTSAFSMHESLYQKRPIYFPLVSAKKNFFLWVNIHKWNDGTLNSILANYLNLDISLLQNRIQRLREELHALGSKDTRQINNTESEIATLDGMLGELSEFTKKVSQLATRGPAPGLTEIEAPYVLDLDDGVMVNSSVLWELVLPLWKDPKKWWVSLSDPKGKKDFDWSHLAMRYWPERVMEKVKKDPSLAVAHSDYGEFKGRDLFAELHPKAAKKWNEQQGKKKERELDFG